MRFPANVEPDGDGFMVSFPDIPEALTCGDTYDEAVSMAHDALLTAMDFYFDDRRAVPEPSKATKGQVLISLPASVSAKVLLLNEMVRQNVRPIDLAARMGTTKQEVNRLTDLKHATKIDTIAKALATMGLDLELGVRRSATAAAR